MKTFREWFVIHEAKGKKPKPNQMPKDEDMKITGKIDLTKISTGHKPHMSGAGKHGERPKPRKKDWKDQED
jgi:hypothetical protein